MAVPLWAFNPTISSSPYSPSSCFSGVHAHTEYASPFWDLGRSHHEAIPDERLGGMSVASRAPRCSTGNHLIVVPFWYLGLVKQTLVTEVKVVPAKLPARSIKFPQTGVFRRR